MKRINQDEHDRMVASAARYLVAKGFRDVKADIAGFPTPAKIVWQNNGSGHVPDVTGWNSAFNLFEVETADSINDQHTSDQWRLFAAYARQHAAVFWVVVPVGSARAAEQRRKDLGLEAQVWEL